MAMTESLELMVEEQKATEKKNIPSISYCVNSQCAQDLESCMQLLLHPKETIESTERCKNHQR